MTKEDTISPRLSSAYMKDKNHLLVEFTEPIDSSKISNNNFYLFDSTRNIKINAKYFYKYDAKPKQFYLAFDEENTFQNYFLVAKNIFDLLGNKTDEDKIQFLFNNELDTTINKPTKVYGSFENDKVDYENPKLKIQFADAVELNDIISRIKIEDTKKNSLQFFLSKIDDALFEIKIDSKLKQASDYFIYFDSKGFKDFSKKTVDTTYKFTITTNSELDFSAASGQIENSDSSDVVFNLKSVNNKNNYSLNLKKKNKFNFEKVIPDKYLLWAFKDKIKNEKYDYGKINPFNYSEEFYFYPDTLNLRARWPVGDIEFRLK